METEPMSSVLASVSTRKEKAAKAMAALHSHRNLITSCITDWENLERSFGVTERALQQKFKELAERETAFDAKMQEARAALVKREESIAGREDVSLARVSEQKDTAMAALVEERRKLEEERMKWKAEKGALVQEREPDVPSKGAIQDVHDTAHDVIKDLKQKGAHKQDFSIATPSKETKELQQKKGSSADLSSKNAHNKEAEVRTGLPKKDEEIKEGKKTEDTSKTKRKDATVADEAVTKRRKEAFAPDGKAAEGSEKGDMVKNAPSLEETIKRVKFTAKTPTSVQIKYFVEKLDYAGLKEFFIQRGKGALQIRPELQAALQASRDPCRFSLKILEVSEGADKIFANSKTGHGCIVLLECLSEIVADPVLGVDFPVVPSDVRETARSMARRWKSWLASHTQESLTLGSHIFLQLLATFGIGTDYSADDLLNFVVSMSRRGIGPALCKTLGLTDKVPVVVDRLIKEGKQIDAIAYACAFGLSDKYMPGTLLRSYLEDLQKAMDMEKTVSTWIAVIGLHKKQIKELKNAIKVLEEYKLNLQLSWEDLHNRITALRQEKNDMYKKMIVMNKVLHNGKANGASNRNSEVGTRPGLDSAHEMRGGYIDSLDRGQYVPTDLGRPSGVDYTPTNIGQPLLPPYNLETLNRKPESTYNGYGLGGRQPLLPPETLNRRPESMYDGYGLGGRQPLLPPYNLETLDRRPESTYDGYGLGGRNPVLLANSNPYASRDSVGSYSGGPASSLPGVPPYSMMTRDDREMLPNFSASHGRLPYPEAHGPSCNQQLGSGLPPSSSYLPYYLR